MPASDTEITPHSGIPEFSTSPDLPGAKVNGIFDESSRAFWSSVEKQMCELDPYNSTKSMDV